MPQTHSSSQSHEDDVPDAPAAPTQAANTDALDDLLDEIDGSLQVNAEQFVRSFVQKGGE
ncbi:ubiquitin-like protein Pup [Demequina aurantiaca]|uniref:ubiquitin-like protein Pup n=1 Tax=Demequina aurantiaca TaxID=676200 RepID=UPI00078103B9|nr:ubiquitin-like protein Pup [Demequina aurantiaca]